MDQSRPGGAADTPASPDALFRPLPAAVLWRAGPLGPRLLLGSAWLLSLALCLFLGLLTLVEGLSTGLPLSLGGIDFYLSLYPPLVIATLWVVWFGFWWGAVPAYLTTLAIALYSGMPLGWSLLFACSNPLGLAVLAVVYRAIPIPYHLRSLESLLFFALLLFVDSVFSSAGSFIWTLTNEMGIHDLFAVWQGWWLGNFLQRLVLDGALVYLLTPRLLRWREHSFPAAGVAAGDRREQVLRAVSTLVLGVIGFVYLSFELSREVAAQFTIGGDEQGWRDAATLISASASVVYWVVTVILVSMLYLGYRFLVHAIEASERAAEKAERASREKSNFLARMSHEIRTPMNAVVGFSKLLGETVLSHGQREYVARISGSAETLLGVIDDVLDYSKIEAGKLHLERLPFDLDDVLGKVDGVVGLRARAKGLELLFSIEPEVPRRLVGDPLRLGQILINLCNNGVKFTEQGRIEVQVGLEGWVNGRAWLRFTVRDSGIGIDPELQGELFAPFIQADGSITRRFGGTGLGLAICRQLSEMMEGRIWVESHPGAGSRFHFTALLGIAAEELEALRPGARAHRYDLSRLRGARVLLVEDNQLNRELAGELLGRAGVHFDTAVNGREAVEMAVGGEYQLVLMDIQMPELDGLAATREIRAREALRGLPIIAMTAHAMSGDRERSLAAGMDDHITKPIDPELLYATLGRWLPQEGSRPRVAAPLPSPATPPPATVQAVLEGIDRRAGLRHHAGDAELYERMLSNFHQHYADAGGRFRRLLAQGETGEARRLAHSLRSTAALIGAEELAGHAAVLDQQLAEGGAEPGRVTAFVEAAERVAAVLAARQERQATLPQVVPMRPLEEGFPLLERLERLLHEADVLAEDVLVELREVLGGPPWDAMLERLVDLVEDVEYEQALEGVAELRRRLVQERAA